MSLEQSVSFLCLVSDVVVLEHFQLILVILRENGATEAQNELTDRSYRPPGTPTDACDPDG